MSAIPPVEEGPACSLRCSHALAVPSLPRARADGALDCLPPLLKATLRWPSLTRRAETLRPLRWLRRRREDVDLPRPAGSRSVPSMTSSDELGSDTVACGDGESFAGNEAPIPSRTVKPPSQSR